MNRRTTAGAILLLAMLALTSSQGHGQPPPPKKEPPKKETSKKEPAKPQAGSLEDALEKAMTSSAEIFAAESKVRDAEAELNRVRQQVLMKVSTLYAELKSAQLIFSAVEEQFLQMSKLQQAGVAPSEISSVRVAMLKQRAVVEKLAAELEALRGDSQAAQKWRAVRYSVKLLDLGWSPDNPLSPPEQAALKEWNAKKAKTQADYLPVSQATQEKIRTALDTNIVVAFETMQVSEVLMFVFGDLLPANKGPEITCRQMIRGEDLKAFSLSKSKVTVGSLLQMIEDANPNLRFYVREYGILTCERGRLDNEAMSVMEFWKKPQPSRE
jgi:hypothetical protein